MKKKIIMILFILLAILFIIFIINLVRNYIIIKDIVDYNSTLKDNISNYYFKYEILGENDNNKTVAEYYYKDRIMLLKLRFMDTETINWYNFNTNEYEIENKEETNNALGVYNEENIYNLALFPYEVKDVVLDYLFKPITCENNTYKIKINNTEYYINKDTKIIEKIISQKKDVNNTITQEKTETSYELKTNCITDKDVEKPNLNN